MIDRLHAHPSCSETTLIEERRLQRCIVTVTIALKT
jgi:hypothetical protein